jgi:hypothetical protein
MTTRAKRRMGWKIGILFVVLCIVIGLLAGWVISRADGAEGDRAARVPAPICDSGGCTSRVTTARMGVRKFKSNRLGHAVASMGYTRQQKRVILDELMAVQRRQLARNTLSFARPLSRVGMWRNFTSHDNCFYRVSSGSPNTAVWSCKGPGPRIPPFDLTRRDVRGGICGGLAGIGVGGALASGVGGPWVWLGIGAGFAACMWQDKLEAMAD